MIRTKAGVLAAAVLVGCFAGIGCNNKLLDPSQVGRFRPTPAVNVILDSLGVAEETPMPWDAAEEPRPSDIVSEQSDYLLCRGDVIRVSILELYAENQMVTNEYQINESGKVSIPDVGVVPAAGLTETQFEEAIKRILSPNILKNPSVSVAMLNSEQRTFSVIGDGVDAPGRHIIPRNDFRLTDALAMARGPRQFNVSHIYVSRPVRTQTAQAPSLPQGRDIQGLQDIAPVGRDGTAYAGQPTLAKQISTPPSGPGGSIASERALLGMVPASPSPSWGPGSGPMTVSADFPKAYGVGSYSYSEIISPVSFDKPGTNGQRGNPWTKAGSSNQARPRTQTGQYNQAGTEQDVSVDWAWQDGKWVPVATRGQQRPAMAQGTVQTQPQPQPMETGRATQSYGQAAPMDQPMATGASPSRPKAASELGPEGGSVEWMFRNGRWMPVLVPGPVSNGPQPDTQAPNVPRPQQRIDTPAPTTSAPRPSPDLAQPQMQPQAQAGPAATGPQDSGIEWVFQGGRWVPVQRGGPEVRSQAPSQFGTNPQVLPLDQGQSKTPEDMTWEEAVRSRLICIPTDKLLAGDPRYNIVVQPGDAIHVPVDIVGECCIMGNVNRAGYINITGRPMTLKMAIAAAGGLGPLAYPKKCEVVRRIGDKREEIVLVDLDRIASGEQPDFFIKPNDLINVGTHFTSRWRAVLRNAFRATYGFGFVYDRNFADADYGTGWPQFFTHWL